MKLIKIIIIFFLMQCFSMQCFAEETIRLTNGEWEPWLSKELKHYGLASHIVSEAFAIEGVKVIYRFYPWKRAYQVSKEGKWDGSVLWAREPEREKNFYFSDKVLDGVIVFFHRKDYQFDWNTVEDLKGIKIGATLEYTYGDKFDAAAKAGKIKVHYLPKDEQNLKKILSRRIQIFPLERDVGYNMIYNNFKPEERQFFIHHPKPIRTTSYHLILSKKIERNKGLIKLFNKGLKKLIKSGKIDQYIKESNKGDYIIK